MPSGSTKHPEHPAPAPPKAEEKRLSPATVEPSYQTFDGDEALVYQQAGGHVVSVTARYPSKLKGAPPMKPGKRYVFLETKSHLDALLAAERARFEEPVTLKETA